MSLFSFFTKQTGQQSVPASESETTSKETSNLPEIKKEDFARGMKNIRLDMLHVNAVIGM